MHPKRKTKISYLLPGGWVTFIILTIPSIVSCDISIIDRDTNQVQFQTASDFVGNSKCGSLDNKNPAIIVDSGAMQICDNPIEGPPISTIETIFYALQGVVFDPIDVLFGTSLIKKFPEPSWLLMVPAEGTCSLHRKLKNAEKAGYSAVIFTTDNPTKKILADLNVEISKVKEKTVLDFHLINSWDVKILSKYTYASSRRRYGLVENIPSISKNANECPSRSRDYRILYSWFTDFFTWWLSETSDPKDDEFQKASDFIQTSNCTSFSVVVDSSPSAMCTTQSPPIYTIESILSTGMRILIELIDLAWDSKLSKKFPYPSWALVISDIGSTCSLAIKLINAEKSGYSALVVITDRSNLDILNNFKKVFNSELDFHFIVPWTDRVLSKHAHDSTRSWHLLDSNNSPKPENCAKNSIRRSKIAYSVITGMWSVLILAIFAVVYFLDKERRRQSGPPPRQPPPRFNARPPPHPPRPRLQSHEIMNEHLTQLGLRRNKKPTFSEVVIAYKQVARKEHPDKHPGNVRERQTEKMQLINKARDFLVRNCVGGGDKKEE